MKLNHYLLTQLLCDKLTLVNFCEVIFLVKILFKFIFYIIEGVSMNNKKYEFIYKSHLRYISIIIFFYTVCTFFVVSCFNNTAPNFHKNNPGWMMILTILWFLLPVVLLNTVFSKDWILKGTGIIHEDNIEIQVKKKKYIRFYSDIKEVKFLEISNSKFGQYSGLRIICGVNNILQFDYAKKKNTSMYSNDLYIFYMALKDSYRKYKNSTVISSNLEKNPMIYAASFEDLSPGYEEVYEPYLTITINNNINEEMVLARFIDGTDNQQTISEACTSVLKFTQSVKNQNGVFSYKRLNAKLSSEEEKKCSII